MPHDEFRFRVQLYDVNAFGEMSPTALLRFLQQAASEASAALGYDAEWYTRHRVTWLIRRTLLEIERPVRYQDELVVGTRVADIRRVRSLRRYEARRGSDGATVAEGFSDWVYVNLARGIPERPPLEMQRAFMPKGITSAERVRRPPPPPPPGAFRSMRFVEFPALDSLPHVNNARYAEYLEQDTWDALAACGWEIDPDARNDGHPRLRRIDVEYFEPASYRDRIENRLWVVRITQSGFTVAHGLSFRNGKPLLYAENTWGWSNGELPDRIRSALSRITKG